MRGSLLSLDGVEWGQIIGRGDRMLGQIDNGRSDSIM